MNRKEISGGVAHKLPIDLKTALTSNTVAAIAWEAITPLARNEWICWVESVKKEETRREHIHRTVVQLKQGKRRPCCWVGCVHRVDKPLNRSQSWVVEKNKKRKS